MMTAKRIVEILLDRCCQPQWLSEASVHLPPRSTKWVAVFTGVEPGKQVWRSTGLTDRKKALEMARAWEKAARQQRQLLGLRPGRANIRVRHREGESPVGRFGPLSQAEIAVLLGMSERAVRNLEKQAIAKLRNHPALASLWEEYKGTLESVLAPAFSIERTDTGRLTGEENAALFGLAQTEEERLVLTKLLKFLKEKTRQTEAAVYGPSLAF